MSAALSPAAEADRTRDGKLGTSVDRKCAIDDQGASPAVRALLHGNRADGSVVSMFQG